MYIIVSFCEKDVERTNVTAEKWLNEHTEFIFVTLTTTTFSLQRPDYKGPYVITIICKRK